MQFMKGKAADEILSHLGEGAEFAGELSFVKGLRVSGIMRGKVRSEATLEIGPGGKIDAEITVRRVVINGEFRGIIRASERVEILKDGKVFGDIYTPCLIIEAGAVFEGRCNMSEKRPASKGEDASPGTAKSAANKAPQMAAKA
jgi:cytoskeletal protein CcmA (bactofilin family)